MVNSGSESDRESNSLTREGRESEWGDKERDRVGEREEEEERYRGRKKWTSPS